MALYNYYIQLYILMSEQHVSLVGQDTRLSSETRVQVLALEIGFGQINFQSQFQT